MFDFFQIFKLDKYGDDNWKDCYLKFKSFGISDVEKFSSMAELKDNKEAFKIVVDVLQEKFVEGKAVKDGEVVEVKKEDLGNLPVQVISDAIQSFSQPTGLNEKKKNSLDTSSEESE